MTTSEQRWPEMHAEARKIANEMAIQINQKAARLETKNELTYKAQGLLECVILELQKKV